LNTIDYRLTISQREQDVAVVRANLDALKARCHDLVTSKVDKNVKNKESDSDLRHRIDQMSLTKKEYDIHRRQLKKKLGILDSVKQMIPILDLQLLDQELLLKTCLEERDEKQHTIARMKEEIEVHLAHFLQNEAIENEKKAELENAIAEVDELEADVLRWMSESKRQAKLLAVLSAQRDIKSRDSARVEQKEREARQHVRIKELIILDLTKRCNEISNRLKEFSALYEVVKNERNKYVNLIQSSTQALAEMREKIRILNNEVISTLL
jgi:DNA-binding CsgD family transcriptional regulator